MQAEVERGLALRAAAATSLGARFVHYSSMDEFQQRFDGSSQVGAVHGARLPLDFKVNPRAGSDTLAVFFNSQQYGQDIKLFTWQRVSEQLNSHRLYISDSSVYASPEVRLGWYSFASGVNVLDRVYRLIEAVSRALGVRRFVFFGSSGGAFPAAQLMERLVPSVGILVCPSLTIPNHQNALAVENWLKYCAESDSIDDFAGRHPEVRLEAWAGDLAADGVSRIVVHNAQDFRFEERDLRPYLNSLGLDFTGADVHDEAVSLLVGDWGPGHTTPPAAEVERLVVEIDSQLMLGDRLDLRNFTF